MIIKPPEKMPDWEARATDILDSYPDQKFVFGKKDCFQLLIEMELAIRGRSLWKAKYGTYSSADFALNVLRKRMKTENTTALADRLYERADPKIHKLGDMTFISSKVSLPVVYFYRPRTDSWITITAPQVRQPKELPTSSMTRAWVL